MTSNQPQWTLSCTVQPVTHDSFRTLTECPLCHALNPFFVRSNSQQIIEIPDDTPPKALHIPVGRFTTENRFSTYDRTADTARQSSFPRKVNHRVTSNNPVVRSTSTTSHLSTTSSNGPITKMRTTVSLYLRNIKYAYENGIMVPADNLPKCKLLGNNIYYLII